jgi:hypothetical protein
MALNAALAAKFWARFVPGAIEEQLRTAAEAVAAARRTGSPELVIESLFLRLLALYVAGDVDEAASVVHEVVPMAERLKEPFYLGVVDGDRARRLLAAGDLAAAEAAAVASRYPSSPELGQGHGVPRGPHVQLLSIRLWQRRGHELVPVIRDLLERVGNESPARVALRLGLLRALAEGGSISEARTEWERVANTELAILTPIGGWSHLTELALAAKICRRLGDVRRAELLRRLLAPWEGVQAQAHLSVYLGPVNQFLGMMEHLVGDHEGAVLHLEDALAFTDRVGARAHSAEIRCELARVLLAREAPGDRRRAETLIENANRVAAACGLVSVLHDCEQLTLHRAAAQAS